MNLADWDRDVSPHLQFIEAGSSMAARHAKMLPCKPGYESLAQDELTKARLVLEAALRDIIAAQSIYASKPAEMQAAE
jgi:hypothetical protein